MVIPGHRTGLVLQCPERGVELIRVPKRRVPGQKLADENWRYFDSWVGVRNLTKGGINQESIDKRHEVPTNLIRRVRRIASNLEVKRGAKNLKANLPRAAVASVVAHDVQRDRC